MSLWIEVMKIKNKTQNKQKKPKQVRASFHVKTYKLKASPNTQHRIEGMVKITPNGTHGLEEIRGSHLWFAQCRLCQGCTAPALSWVWNFSVLRLSTFSMGSSSPLCFFCMWSRVVFHLSPFTHLLAPETTAQFSQLIWNLYWFPANKKVEKWDFLYFNNLSLLSRMVVCSQRCFLKIHCDLLRIEWRIKAYCFWYFFPLDVLLLCDGFGVTTVFWFLQSF